MAEFRVQIPQELLDAGFPVEWLVVTDEGAIIVHYSTPVLLENMTLDDRPILHLTTGLKLLIGTGETVELQMKLARPFMEQVHGCPNCHRELPETPQHPWCNPLDVCGTPQCWECDRMLRLREMGWRRRNDPDAIAHDEPPFFRQDGYCDYCGQMPVKTSVLADAMTVIGNKRVLKRDGETKSERELRRLRRRNK